MTARVGALQLAHLPLSLNHAQTFGILCLTHPVPDGLTFIGKLVAPLLHCTYCFCDYIAL